MKVGTLNVYTVLVLGLVGFGRRLHHHIEADGFARKGFDLRMDGQGRNVLRNEATNHHIFEASDEGSTGSITEVQID